jgi:hypothetical protein
MQYRLQPFGQDMVNSLPLLPGLDDIAFDDSTEINTLVLGLLEQGVIELGSHARLQSGFPFAYWH